MVLIRWRDRALIVPFFLLNTKSDPFALVKVVLLPIVGPDPALLLRLADVPVRQVEEKERHYLQEAVYKEQMLGYKYIVKEVQGY